MAIESQLERSPPWPGERGDLGSTYGKVSSALTDKGCSQSESTLNNAQCHFFKHRCRVSLLFFFKCINDVLVYMVSTACIWYVGFDT